MKSARGNLKAEDIELRSMQLREILGQVPRWIIRYGTLIIVTVLLILVVGSSFLKYPDIITARITLTTEIPPADIAARVSARIEQLLVADKELVSDGQVLAVLESAADFHHVFMLEGLLGDHFRREELIGTVFPENLKLGPIQESYALFQKRLQEYSSFAKLDYYNRKIEAIRIELKKYSLFRERLREQEEVLRKDYQLSEKQYRRDSLLFMDRVIASSQLEKSETQKLAKLYEWKDTQTRLAAAEIDAANLNQEILEMELKLEENGRNFIQQLQEAYEMLKGELAVWDEKYVIRSPLDGQVSFTRIWSRNQQVGNGETVLTVLPVDQGGYVGKAFFEARGVGKIKEGLQVIIRFDNFPYMEFGTVSGRVSSLSLVPNNDRYTAEIRLDSSALVTNYGIALDFQQNMPGLAEIITEQRTLMQRITDPFRAVVGRQQVLRQ